MHPIVGCTGDLLRRKISLKPAMRRSSSDILSLCFSLLLCWWSELVSCRPADGEEAVLAHDTDAADFDIADVLQLQTEYWQQMDDDVQINRQTDSSVAAQRGGGVMGEDVLFERRLTITSIQYRIK